MSALSPQEFHLERTDQFYGIGEPGTSAAIRPAGEVEQSLHNKFLAELKGRASRLIENGAKSHSPLYAAFSVDSLWHLRYGNPHPKTRIVDDKLHRFMWVRDAMVCAVSRYEIQLTLAACNLLGEGQKPVFTFVDGQLESYPDHDFGETSLAVWEDELHDKVLEVNPSWRGALDGLIQVLVLEHRLRYQTSNIGQWPIESVFSQSANYLYSLLEEINRAVFNNIGRIKDDVWEDEPEKGPAKGFSLYVPKNNWNPEALGFIGVRENGKFEIRIQAQREKSEYWDTDLNGMIDTLHQAIIWWKEFGEYTAEERIQLEEDLKRANLEKEAKAFRTETRICD